MTMLAMLKSILWNGPTTVHLQLTLHLTDLCLLSVSGTGAAVGKETNNRKLKPAGIIGQPATATFSAPHKQALDQGCLNLCCLAMSKNYSQWCSFRLDCQISVRTRDWNYFEIARKISVPPWSWEGPRRFMVPVPGEGPLPPPVSGERPAKAKQSHYVNKW